MLNSQTVVVEERKIIVQVEEGPKLLLAVPGKVRVLEVGIQGPPGPPGGSMTSVDGGEF